MGWRERGWESEFIISRSKQDGSNKCNQNALSLSHDRLFLVTLFSDQTKKERVIPKNTELQ